MLTYKNTVDLHVHSNYSDGTLRPREIVKLASKLGIKTMSLTDHDTVDGVYEAIETAVDVSPSVNVIPGVEISADFRRELHILGYFSKERYSEIGPFLDSMRRERNVRNRGIIEKLNAIGIKIKSREVADLAGNEVYGRPHIADALVRKGYAHSTDAAFKDYLSGGRKAYVKKISPPPADCVRAIRDAGGLPVIAHPVNIGIKLSDLRDLLTSLIPHGLFGLEAHYPENTPQDTKTYTELASQLNLLPTGGSDYHGAYRKSTALGSGKGNNLIVPDYIAEKIAQALMRG